MSEQRRLKQAALEAARRQGCTCKPDVTLTGSAPFWRADVAHDDWCPLYRARERPPADLPTGPVVFVPPGWKANER